MATPRRRILVFAPLRHTFAELCAAVRRQPWVKAEVGAARCAWHGRGLSLVLDLVDSSAQAAELLASHYYNLVLVDCRNLPDAQAAPEQQVRALEELLEALRRVRDPERHYPSGRVVVLVGDADEERVDRLIFALGRDAGACLRDRSLAAWLPAERREEARDRFVEQLWSLCYELLKTRRKGSKAICAAGGGITGIYYELGVLKCLRDTLSLDVRDFDLFFGISAGAVVTSWLANRISVDETIARLGEVDDQRSYQPRLTWRHLNCKEVPRRLLLAQREVVRYTLRMLQRQDELSVASIMATWSVLLGPLFDASEFEAVLRGLFTSDGRSNDFRELPARLFIGATDQDTREHVLFGSEGLDDVPISRAVQASIAMHPFFPSVEIGGRFYTDGVVTRTSNIKAAVDRGADLIFVLDPFVPLISDQPGLNARHGNTWIFVQDLKTMSFTRFEQMRNDLVRQHPQVSLYTFLPGNRMRRLMSGQNPFVARNFDAIVCEAYRSTRRRLADLEYRIRGDLAAHGITLDLEPAGEKVERLERARRPDVRYLLETGPTPARRRKPA